MNIIRLQAIHTLSFTVSQAAEALGLGEPSAKVALHGYVKSGFVMRLKRGVYILKDRWQNLGDSEKLVIANQLQVPSYISLSSALAYYGVTTQVPQDYVESIALVRSRQLTVDSVLFRYSKIQKKYFRDFVKQKNIFIAKPEKALLDALYLVSLGRYRLDLSAIDMGRLNRKELAKTAKIFPSRVLGMLPS